MDITYEELVQNLAKPGEDILEELTPGQANAWHMATGVSGEAGELLDAVKKHVVYQKDIDLENVIEELGDLEFYMEGLRAELGITREETLRNNMNKLLTRYHSGTYSNDQAKQRADKIVIDANEEPPKDF